MNFFEQELRRIANACIEITNPVFAGRACYGELGGDNRVKLQFVTQGTMERYEAVKATVLNRADGEVDSLLFRFSDTWGKKHINNNPNFREGLIPYVWTYNGKSEWYAYRPNNTDINKLAAELGVYLGVFTDRSFIFEKPKGRPIGKESVVEQIREATQTAALPKDTPARKKSEPDL